MVSIALFMHRRKLARLANCSAMSSATNWACISGRAISSILMLIRRPTSSCSSPCSRSTSWPLRPMMMPGRAVNSITLTSSRVRSISTLGMPAKLIFLLDELAELQVLEQQAAEFLLRGIPAALPAFHDSDTETDRIDFLTHTKPRIWLTCACEP